LRFSYSSMTTPSEVYDYDMAGRTRILRKRQEIPSGHNPADYVTTRIMASSHDGAQVPVSLLHRHEFVRDGNAPLLLYGYGAYGGSAGGMLMGAVANRASELFAGIVAEVPFVDVLNTMLDDSLPLTPPEWPEWGNPIESEKDFRTILSYSPYDNVAAKEYPA